MQSSQLFKRVCNDVLCVMLSLSCKMALTSSDLIVKLIHRELTRESTLCDFVLSRSGAVQPCEGKKIQDSADVGCVVAHNEEQTVGRRGDREQVLRYRK